jgi:serine/threonine-protein kinase
MPARQPKSGDVIGGKYRVERVLGAGGMGVVVLARHLDLGQRVAVKLMLEEATVDPAHAARFAREARSAVQLRSAHTARVLDVGRLKNGEPFMVMEYLEGHDLDEVIQRGPLPAHVAVDYVLQTCEAFAEAHALGMVHRDIKPKNLFLTRTIDGRALVKVLDFGLAKKVGVGAEVSLTATSAVFGSPQYMSPEQMRSAKDVDARSDIWSIGVCLYELLTGRVPFDAAGVAEICAMVLKDPVPPPSRWLPGIPADLEAVVLRCLEKDPALRYQTVAELAFALQPYGAEEGSARRVLHVMQTTAADRDERARGATAVVTVDPGAAVDGAQDARTLSAFASGPQASSVRGSFIAACAGVVAALAIGAGAFAWAKAGRAPATIATGSAAPEPPVTAAAAPGPEANAPDATGATPNAEAEGNATDGASAASAASATSAASGPGSSAKPAAAADRDDDDDDDRPASSGGAAAAAGTSTARRSKTTPRPRAPTPRPRPTATAPAPAPAASTRPPPTSPAPTFVHGDPADHI